MPPDEFLAISYPSGVKITRQNILRSLTYAARKYARGKLVDLGCGGKPYEPVFRPYTRSSLGVDNPATFSDHTSASPAVDRWADCAATGLPGATFNTVLSTQVLEHLPDPGGLIAEAYRLLVPGGTCITTAPMLWELHAEPVDFFRFTKFGLIRLFERAGFQLLEVTPLEGAFAALKQMEILTLHLRPIRAGAIRRGMRWAVNLIRIPVTNYLALRLDGVRKNSKLCLNYLVVAMKPTS